MNTRNRYMIRKLNVLFISNQGGGAPKSLLNMIKSLHGWVNPIVLFENDWYDYQAFKKEGIECLIVPYRMNMVLDEPGCKTVKWKIHRFIDEWTKNHLAPYCIAKKLKGRNIDIVHTNTGAITIGLAVAKKLQAKHVWHLREFQDIDFGGHPYCGWTRFYDLLSQSDAIISITQAVHRHFRLDNHKNSHVIWNAVRSKKDAMIDEEKEDYILYCSSMIRYPKGLHDLIDAYAMSSLPQQGVKLKVLGIMDADYEQVILDKIAKNKLDDSVLFLGNQSNPKPFFAKAKAFVLPSLNEGLGRVVIEAMFYGCPVIVRKSGGPLEYIEDHVNGYFFDTTKELASLLEKVCMNDQSEVIKKAQDFVLSHFSEEVYGQEILSVYKDVLAHPNEG